MEIIIASRNLGKIRELREMLGKVPGLDVSSLLAYPNYVSPEETGGTFQANAELKALHAAKEFEQVILADDSGLVVPTLDGAPGPLSRRYAGDEATDWENRQKLLKELEGKSGLSRQAFFECSLVLADKNGILKKCTGHCEGFITNEERGRHGFGYDPIFVKNDYDKTFSELTEDVKNRVSHRRKAVDSIIPFLESYMYKLKSHSEQI